MFPIELASVLTGASIPQLRRWNRTELLVPEGVDGRPMLWSYNDLVALRTVVRLRRETSLQKVRKAFGNLNPLRMMEHPATYRFVTLDNTIIVQTPEGDSVDVVAHPGAQVLATFEEVLGPFEYRGREVVDFRRPRQHLSVQPGRLGGWPTIEDSRIGYDTIALLAEGDGVTPEVVRNFYPRVTDAQIRDAVSLHHQVQDAHAAA